VAPPHAELAALLSPTLRQALQGRELRISERVRGLTHGSHRSRRVAAGDEFLDHRAYTPGDDLRRLDWRAAARRDRWVLRRTRAEGSHQLCLLIDGGANMAYGGEHPKFAAAKECAAALAWLGARANDRMGYAIGGVKLELDKLAPRGDSDRRREFARELASHEPAGACDWASLIAALPTRLTAPSLVCMLSDWLDPFDPRTPQSAEEVWQTLAELRAAGHLVVLLQTLHGDELDFPWEGDEVLRFVDPHSRRPRREGPGRALRAGYLERLHAHLDALEQRCESAGVLLVRAMAERSRVSSMLQLLGALAADLSTESHAHREEGA
jgi:uncharacterized protein (DUF58 family)